MKKVKTISIKAEVLLANGDTGEINVNHLGNTMKDVIDGLKDIDKSLSKNGKYFIMGIKVNDPYKEYLINNPV